MPKKISSSETKLIKQRLKRYKLQKEREEKLKSVLSNILIRDEKAESDANAIIDDAIKLIDKLQTRRKLTEQRIGANDVNLIKYENLVNDQLDLLSQDELPCHHPIFMETDPDSICEVARVQMFKPSKARLTEMSHYLSDFEGPLYISSFSLRTYGKDVWDFIDSMKKSKEVSLLINSGSPYSKQKVAISEMSRAIKKRCPQISIRTHPGVHFKCIICPPNDLFISTNNLGADAIVQEKQRIPLHDCINRLTSRTLAQWYLSFHFLPLWHEASEVEI